MKNLYTDQFYDLVCLQNKRRPGSPLTSAIDNKEKSCWNVKHFSFMLILTIMSGFLIPVTGLSQTIPNEALWTDNGWSLKKVVSNTSIPSGVNFSYTIIFSAPAGTSSISIQDLVPSSLQVVSVTSAGPVCSVTPVTNVAGNLVTYNLTGLSPSCAPMGSFTIVVKFPEGITCNGETARNKAEIMVDGKWQSTPYVSTSATAVNPWKVTKYIIAKASVNPNGGTCGYIMAPDDTITYRLAVLKDNLYFGNVTGQQNMSSAVVQDALPPGAVFISSTNPTCVSFSGGTITWNVNCSPVTVPAQLLDATNPWAYYWVDIKVKYPVGSFPVNTQILNQATLTGVSCNQQYSNTSNQTCITVTPANPSGQFGKYINLVNRVPGCNGVYTMVFCNNGNVPLSAFNITDAIPSGVSVNSVSIYGANGTTTMNLQINGSPYATGITNYYTSPALTGVNNLQFQMTGSLPVGGCIYMYINFTVNPNPVNTVVTNCATFNGLANGLTLPQVCASFTVAAGTPVPCVFKEICSPQNSYEPGDTVRYRVRVQNIGSATMTGANIQDLLHSNLTYLGNESYFVSNTYNPGCSTGPTPPSGTTAWSGVTTSHAGNNLQWSVPPIASDCQLFYYTYCGYYGTYGIPYYYIEFDAVVDSLALPGVTPNSFQISGGNLTGTTNSNVVNILITASFGQEVTKFLSTDNGVNYAGSGTTAPGSTMKYRLNYKNTSNVPLSNIRLIDLLPKDDAPNNDWLIFNRSISRGSQFSVNYVGNHATSLSPAAPAPTPVLQWAPGTNICLPPYVASGCTPTTWGAVQTSNVRMDYGSFSLAPAKNLREDFDVTIPLTAQNGQIACNDFAAIASANFLLNGSPQSVALTPLAAPPVCVNVAVTPLCCDSVLFQQVQNANGQTGCCARIKTKCDVDSVNVDVFGGTIGSVSWTCGPLPSGYSGQTNYTFPANGCAVDMTACINLPQAGVAILTYTIYFSNGEKCRKVLDLICEATPSSCCDSIDVRQVQNPTTNSCCTEIISKCEVDSIQVTVSNGTLSSASWNCGPIAAGYAGQSTWTFNAGGCAADLITCVDAKQSGVVTVNYLVFLSNGEKCEKRVQLDCKAAENCCENIDVRQVQNPTTNSCCTEIISKCDVDSIQVSVQNGTISSASWNCGTIPAGYVGQSTWTFNAGGCAADLVTCFNATQTGVVTVNYVIFLSNGEKCEQRIQLDCKATENCCENIDVHQVQNPTTNSCCTEIISKCEVDSIQVTVSNGTLSSASWNCGPIAAGYAGQSTWTFNAGGCAADLITCVDAKQSGVVTVNYLVFLSNGEKCEKRVQLDCKETCCEKTRLEKVIDAAGNETCCVNLITECEVKAIQVDVQNGTISSASWNCGPLPAGYLGQSSFVFPANGCVVDMTNCFNAIQPGIVIATYSITFQNGETCKKIIELDCKVPLMNCCDSINVRQVAESDIKRGCCTEITSKCDVDSILVSVVNGTISSASWNCGTIPAGYVGQSTWTFNAGGCAADLVTCFNATQTGVVTVNYVIFLSNGEKCEQRIQLDCKETCCEKTRLEKVIDAAGNETCCVNLITECEVKAIHVDVQNGTISSASWNCGSLPTGYAGQSSFVFPANGCVVDMTNCFNAIQPGIVIATYSITFQNGETCKKIIELDCKVPLMNCCDSINVEQFSKPGDEKVCCTEITSRCDVDSILVSVVNGTISSASWNCGTIPTGYVGQSTWTFNAGGCAADLVTCFDSTQTGVVTVNYVIYLSNGEKCEKQIKLDCTSTAIYEKGGSDFEFLKLFPNPASGSFNITYSTEKTRDIEIRLVNSAGQMVKVIKRDREQPGTHTVKVQSDGLIAGVYQVVLYSQGEVLQKSAVLNK